MSATRVLEGHYCARPGCVGTAEGVVVLAYADGPIYLCADHLVVVRAAVLLALRQSARRYPTPDRVIYATEPPSRLRLRQSTRRLQVALDRFREVVR